MKLRCVLTALMFALLLVSVATNANAQSWASTATQAYPVSTLSNATLIGALGNVLERRSGRTCNFSRPTTWPTGVPGEPWREQFQPTASEEL
jgi:MFS-type transporter involved in bile tolerance (Atg22 family)